MSGNEYIDIGIALIAVSTVLFIGVIAVILVLYKRNKNDDR